MADTLKMQNAVRRLAKARQRRSIAALRGNPVAETVAIGEEQRALLEISRLRREAAAEEARDEVDRAERLPFTDWESDDDDDQLVASYAQ